MLRSAVWILGFALLVAPGCRKKRPDHRNSAELHNEAVYRLQRGEYPRAEQLLKKALTRRNYAPLHNNLALVLRLQPGPGQLETALKHCQKAVSLEQQDGQIYLNCAFIAAQAKKPELAKDYQAKLTGLDAAKAQELSQALDNPQKAPALLGMSPEVKLPRSKPRGILGR